MSGDVNRNGIIRKQAFPFPFGLDLVAHIFQNLAPDLQQFFAVLNARNMGRPTLHLARNPAIQLFE